MSVLPGGTDLLVGLAEKVAPEARERLHAQTAGGLLFLAAAVPAPFHAVFTTRVGGRSSGGFASLNLSQRVGDRAETVAENRETLAREMRAPGAATALGPLLELLSPPQEHGLRVMSASEWRATGPDTSCDGLIIRLSRDKGLAPLLLFADCVPVILVGSGEIAVLHCGWRGLLAGMIQAGAEAMSTSPRLAFIGPSIGPCCFPVQEDVARLFTERYGSGLVDGRGKLDLWEVAARALAETGVPAADVVNPRLCTVCNEPYFYSHRRQKGLAGRQGAVAWEE